LAAGAPESLQMRFHAPKPTIKTVATSLCLLLAGYVLGTAVLPARSGAAPPSPAFIPPAAPWLQTVNYYRAMAGVGAVVEDPTMTSAAVQHSCYMLQNGITHDEVPGNPGYTAAGDAAGNNGNVAVSSVINTSARSHIELWMSGPFHAIGVIRPNLQSTGFGACDQVSTPTTWHSAATLDVLRGLGSAPRPAQPVLFPGNGTTTNLDRFVTESPNPLDFCGWTGQAVGLPIIALMPEVPTSASGSVTGPNGPIETCVLSGANTNGVAQQILQADNAVIVIPRTVLSEGTYQVTVGTAARTTSWQFGESQAAAVGLAPVEGATPAGPRSGYTPLAPVRVVDSRTGLGTTPLAPQIPTRIQITGTGNVPNGAAAVQVNVTVTAPAGPGYLSVWSSCSAPRPEVSTVNFAAKQTVANAATIPVASDGSICVVSTAATDLLIDVSGYYSGSEPANFAPVVPVRLMDSRVGLGTAGRLAAGQPVELSVVKVAGVPADASAVALNVTGILPSADAFVTTYPCGDRPVTSTLNPALSKLTPNLTLARVSPTGTVCFFSNTDIDLVVDVVGYISTKATNKLTPSTPFRFTDTRDLFRPEINAGRGGSALGASETMTVQMAGVRGIPANARAISANVTVVGAAAPGFVVAFPCGAAIPTASTVNYEVNNAIANAAELPLSAGGAICIYSSGSAHVIIDVNGWWS
jgi:Cysteine-rich secretory protein family